jgi:hypothetical protein
MRNLICLTLSSFVLAACASGVKEGERVFIVPSDAAHLSNCKLLGPVKVEAEIFSKWDANEMRKEIKFRLRDKAALEYPDGDTVAHGDLNVGGWGTPDAEQMGTVFKCFGN